MQIIDKLLDIKKLVRNGIKGENNSLSSILDNEILRTYLFEQLSKKPFEKSDFIFLFEEHGFKMDFFSTEIINTTINGKPSQIHKSWIAIPYLRKAGDFVLHSQDKDLTVNLIKVIDSYTSFVLSNNTDVYNLDDYTMGEIILRLPFEYIFHSQYLNFLRQRCLDNRLLSISTEIIEQFYPRVLLANEKQTALLTIKLLFDYRVSLVGFTSVESKVDPFYLKDFVSKFSEKSFALIGLRLFKFLFDLIEDVDAEDKYSFTTTYINSLFDDSSDNLSESYQDIIIDFIKKGINELLTDDITATLFLLNYYDGAIFHRIRLYILGTHYEKEFVQNYFWQLDSPINNGESANELSYIIGLYNNLFTNKQKEIYTSWVNTTQVSPYPNESKDDYETRSNKVKNYWNNILNSESAAESSNDSSEFYRKEKFPNAKYRLAKLEDKDLLLLLRSADQWGDYNQYGLLYDIRQLDTQMCKKLISGENATQFLPEVLYSLIQKFSSNDLKEPLDWISFFNLINFLINREDLWDFEKYKINTNSPQLEQRINYNSHLWIEISQVFKQAANKRDKAFFNQSDCIQAIHVLIDIEKKYKGVFKTKIGQEYIDSTNSFRGSIYNTLIELAITQSILNDKKEFASLVSIFFSSRLQQIDAPEELFWVIGGNLVKIGYMNISWIKENSAYLFESKKGADLKVLKSYLLYTSTVYRDLYEALFRYYKLSIILFSESSNHTNKLIQHICVAALDGWSKSHELVDEVFINRNVIHFNEIIKCYSQKTKKSNTLNPLGLETVISLWQRILNILKSKEFQNVEEMSFNLLKWVQHFNDLSERVVSLVKQTIELIPHYPFDYITLEYFKLHSSINPTVVGEIINNGLARSKGFDISTYEALSTITKNLYQYESSKHADQIVTNLIDKNLFFLVDIYEENH